MKREFRVSTKAAIFNRARDKVLVIHIYQSDGWGLPGGHVEEGEDLDETMVREIREECGVEVQDLKHVDFFIHTEGKLILAYKGTVRSEALQSLQDNLEGVPKWLSRDEFEAIDIEPGYRELVMSHWC